MQWAAKLTVPARIINQIYKNIHFPQIITMNHFLDSVEYWGSYNINTSYTTTLRIIKINQLGMWNNYLFQITMTYVAENADQILSDNFASYTLRTKILIWVALPRSEDGWSIDFNWCFNTSDIDNWRMTTTSHQFLLVSRWISWKIIFLQ